MPTEVRRTIVKGRSPVPGGHVQQSYPYYSAVKFQFTVAKPAATATLTYAAGTEVTAFNYAKNQALAGAGFPGALTATPLETNLIKPSETLGGERVRIYGLSFMLAPDSDAYLARLVFASVSVKLSLNGEQQAYNLGPLSMIPGAGGLNGTGVSRALEGDYLRVTTEVGAVSNGLPGAANYFKLPTPITWAPPGGADSTLCITARCERAITVTATDRAASAAAGGSTGAAAYTAPAAAATTEGTYVWGWFVLKSITAAPRSQNA